MDVLAGRLLFPCAEKQKRKLLDMYGTAENIYNMKKQVLNEPDF